MKHCRMNYIPRSEVRIEEQLFGFRGGCPLQIDILNKPNKYEIKFKMMCHSTSKYMIDADPYIARV